MTLFVCLDEQGGMSFGGRRQSRDSAVLLDIFATVNTSRLLVSRYSEKLLSQYGEVTVSDTPLADAGEDDFVLLEVEGVGKQSAKPDTLIIYRWDGIYPSDLKFDLEPQSVGLSLLTRSYIVGTSHEKITKEVYTK